MGDAWIVDVVRTPRGKGRPDGGLHGHASRRPSSGAAWWPWPPARGSIPAEVDDVIAGNGILAGEHGDDIARLSVLLVGWPETVPGMTLNRFCGSGQQAVTVAAMGVGSGAQDLVVAGGVESMSRWDVGVGALDHRRRQPGPARAGSHGAAGHLGRPDRDARGLHPRGRRRLRGREPAPRRGRDRARAGSTVA